MEKRGDCMDMWSPERFDALYKENFERLKKIATRILGSAFIAEEIVQDTFMVMLCKKKDVEEHPSPAAWLARTLRFQLANELRKAHYLREVPLMENALAVATERPEALFEILPRNLSERDRQILIWYFENRLDTLEIACRLGIPVETVRTQIYRAKNRYKEYLKKNHLGETKSRSEQII